jgi:hypothetical protein
MTAHDEDYDDPRQRCQHGTFIGSWWGPDYLCGRCEDGVSVHEMHRILAEQRAWRWQARAVYDAMVAVLSRALQRSPLPRSSRSTCYSRL